jgi:serine protease
MRRLSLLLLSLLAGLSSSLALAGNDASKAQSAASLPDADSTDRFIVKLRDPTGDPRAALAAIGGTFGERLEHVRRMSGGAHVVRIGRRLMNMEARAVAGRLRSDSRVALFEPDVVLHPMLVPNDTMYAQQWHYYEPQGGINLPPAWDRTTGSGSVTVAVIDTGVLPHADLASRLAPGYDFVANVAGGSDPGDYGCNGSTSSWHGTHVAGTIGAISNNGNGVTGVNWGSRILPVRVLGRCGGYTSDIADGMRWAAGIAVAGVPGNPFPARVENLSLGGAGSCSSTLQSAVNDVVARGTVVVVAAGNSGADAANTQPASCNGVIAVAATTRNGGRAGYSNFGSRVTVSAPGGGGNDAVLSTLNTGTTTPAADTYAWFQGTSMATPHVSGVVSLMLSLDPALTPAQVAQRLQQSARAFPSGTGSDCSVASCGAGIVDAAASVNAVAPVPAPAPSPPPDSGWTKIADEGQAFTVSGTQTVRYGHAPYWITRTVTNEGSCTNAFFANDPIVGTVKQCEVMASGAAPPAGWTRIAGEGQTFAVVGAQTVRYGSGAAWVTRTVVDYGECTNSFFGIDPIVGVVKQCEVAGSSTAPPPSGWTQIATEGQLFNVAGTQTVRYGTGSAWLTRSVTSSGECSNAFFGADPAFGIVKRCEVAGSGSTALR